jgi:hypothetical protein
MPKLCHPKFAHFWHYHTHNTVHWYTGNIPKFIHPRIITYNDNLVTFFFVTDDQGMNAPGCVWEFDDFCPQNTQRQAH